VRSEGYLSMKNPLTPAGIEPATFRFVAQHFSHCATAVTRTSCRCSNTVMEFALFLSTRHRRLRWPENEADDASASVAAEFIGVA